MLEQGTKLNFTLTEYTQPQPGDTQTHSFRLPAPCGFAQAAWFQAVCDWWKAHPPRAASSGPG